MGLFSTEMYFFFFKKKKKVSNTQSHCITHLVAFYKWDVKSSQLQCYAAFAPMKINGKALYDINKKKTRLSTFRFF